MAPVETDPKERERLVELGYLTDADARGASLQEAVQAYFSDSLDHR